MYLLGLSVGRGAAATPEPLLPHWAAFLEATVADLTRNQENYDQFMSTDGKILYFYNLQKDGKNHGHQF
jgi:hypothetical protein